MRCTSVNRDTRRSPRRGPRWVTARAAQALTALLLGLGTWIFPGLGPGVAAQDIPAPMVRYVAEIIVFRHLDRSGTTAEIAAPDEQAPLPTPADPTAVSLPAWPEVEPADLRLTTLASRLRRGGRYELLYHGGWIQPVESQDRAVPTPLAVAATGSGLTGTVTLYLERYLHALVDIALISPAAAVSAEQRVRQSRRLRGTAVHYFDSPWLGVIMLVRPADEVGTLEPAEAPTAGD